MVVRIVENYLPTNGKVELFNSIKIAANRKTSRIRCKIASCSGNSFFSQFHLCAFYRYNNLPFSENFINSLSNVTNVGRILIPSMKKHQLQLHKLHSRNIFEHEKQNNQETKKLEIYCI